MVSEARASAGRFEPSRMSWLRDHSLGWDGGGCDQVDTEPIGVLSGGFVVACLSCFFLVCVFLVDFRFLVV